MLLRFLEHRSAGISAYAHGYVGTEFAQYFFCHTHRAPQAHEHAEIAPQALAVESAYGESDNLISGSRNALHLHASFGSDKQYLDVGHPPAQCIGY